METKCLVITNGKVQEFISIEEHSRLMKDQLLQRSEGDSEEQTLKEKELYSIPDFIKKFQITRPTMYNWIEKGLIKGAKVGGRMYITGDSVRDLITKSA